MADGTESQGRRGAALGFGAANLASAVLVYLGVFEGLPARYWPIDFAAGSVTALFAGAGVGLLARARWGTLIARIASTTALLLGLLLVSTLALTASYLSGIYGPVGRGGALILTLIGALALPYLVVLPAAQLVWLGPWRKRNLSGQVSSSAAGS